MKQNSDGTAERTHAHAHTQIEKHYSRFNMNNNLTKQQMIQVTRVLPDGSRLTIESIRTITFPAGVRVLVTDPCYYFTNDETKDGYSLWSKFCDALFDPSYKLGYGRVVYTLKTGETVSFLFSNTVYGDGKYEARCNYSKARRVSGSGVSVDAGIFSITMYDSVGTFDPANGYTDDSGDMFRGGVVFETLRPVTVTMDGRGNMSGDISCATE